MREVELPVERELIVIDDGSSDDTAAIAESLAGDDLVVIRQPENRGKGAAIRRGLEAATGELVLVQDADLEYEPGDVPALLEPLLSGEADVVYGSRILRKENRRGHGRYYLGGRLVTWWTNLLYGSSLTDEPTCYKLFRTELVRGLDLRCTGFEFCPEVTGKLLRRGVPIRELPIHYAPRSMEEGKKIRWTDGLEALWTLLRIRLLGR